MYQNRFDAVFVTGLVRNNTTRHTLEPSLLINYTGFCEEIIAENMLGRIEDLYILATRHLEKLQYDNNY